MHQFNYGAVIDYGGFETCGGVVSHIRVLVMGFLHLVEFWAIHIGLKVVL
jgi:hypothetical protein